MPSILNMLIVKRTSLRIWVLTSLLAGISSVFGPLSLDSCTLWHHDMARCDLCHDLRKRDADDPRLAAEMTAEQLLSAEKPNSCDICSFIVKGIRHFENRFWSLKGDVSRIYVYALSSRGDSLTVELYFHTDRPKFVLEFYHTSGKLPICFLWLLTDFPFKALYSYCRETSYDWARIVSWSNL
jgi:hypothetical protein